MTFYNKIVTLNVSETVAPTPSTLQGTAAIVSNGGTTVPTGTLQFIASSGVISSFITPPFSIATIAWTTGVVALTTSLPHGIPVGETTTITVAGVTPAGYNGTFTATSATTTELTYSLASNPGTETVLGTVLTGPQIYLQAADAT